MSCQRASVLKHKALALPFVISTVSCSGLHNLHCQGRNNFGLKQIVLFLFVIDSYSSYRWIHVLPKKLNRMSKSATSYIQLVKSLKCQEISKALNILSRFVEAHVRMSFRVTIAHRFSFSGHFSNFKKMQTRRNTGKLNCVSCYPYGTHLVIS